MGFLVSFLVKRLGVSSALGGLIGYGGMALLAAGLFFGVTHYYYKKGVAHCNAQWEQGVADAKDRADGIQDEVNAGAVKFNDLVNESRADVRQSDTRLARESSIRLGRIEQLLEDQRYAEKNQDACGIAIISRDSRLRHQKLDRILSGL